MMSDDLQRCLDLRRADSDPELFAAAVAVQYIRRLIAAGGDSIERLDEEEALHPHHLQAFLALAVENAHKTERFEQEWCRLQRLVPRIQAAWERGQALFQEDLVCAMTNPVEMKFLPRLRSGLDSSPPDQGFCRVHRVGAAVSIVVCVVPH
jgi:hypothetical protein